MKIALTGVGEVVGARLIESFHLGSGPSVAAVGRHPAEFTSAARFALELRLADFLNVDALARSFAGCSAVVHAARLAPADMKRGATVLCRAAAQAGVRRIVFISSADVHGLSPAPNTTERSALPVHQASEELGALVQAERQFLSECKQLGIAAYVLRAGYLFGPRAQTIAELAASLEEERARLLQNGDGICNSLYVDNLVSAIRLTLKAKAGAGSAFLITDAETVTWRDFYHSAAAELRVSPSSIQKVDNIPPAATSGDLHEPESNHVRHVPPATEKSPAAPPPANGMLARQQCAWKLPTTRASAELGYEASVSFAEGMRRSIAWWRFAHGEFFTAA